MHDLVLRDDPFVSRAVGPHAVLGAMTVRHTAAVRVAPRFDDHLLVWAIRRPTIRYHRWLFNTPWMQRNRLRYLIESLAG